MGFLFVCGLYGNRLRWLCGGLYCRHGPFRRVCQKAYDLAELYKVFGDTTRIKILSVLRLQEMCVCDIADSLSMTQSAISHQLRVLKQMDLVKNRREGKTIFYSLADDHIVGILDLGLEHIRE